MTKYCFIIKDDNNKNFRTIFSGFDYCEMIEKLNDYLNACYYDWEILKMWKL